jgi:uncharacterized protein (DUF983 family)
MGIFRRHDEHPSDAAPAPEPEIDLRESPPQAVWGLPSRCPECGDFGYLDRIDVVNEVMYQHCPACWHKWETARADTVSEV